MDGGKKGLSRPGQKVVTDVTSVVKADELD